MPPIVDFDAPQVKVLETGLLQGITGFKGGVLDAEVIDVAESKDSDSLTIDIVIPLEQGEVDRVQLVSPGGQPLKLKNRPQISMSNDNHEARITVTLSKKNKLGFKLKLIDLPDE